MNKRTKSALKAKPQNVLGGDNARGEPAGCPTGLVASDTLSVVQPDGRSAAEPGTPSPAKKDARKNRQPAGRAIEK